MKFIIFPLIDKLKIIKTRKKFIYLFIIIFLNIYGTRNEKIRNSQYFEIEFFQTYILAQRIELLGFLDY